MRNIKLIYNLKQDKLFNYEECTLFFLAPKILKMVLVVEEILYVLNEYTVHISAYLVVTLNDEKHITKNIYSFLNF